MRNNVKKPVPNLSSSSASPAAFVFDSCVSMFSMVPLCPTLFCPKLITQFTAKVHKFFVLIFVRSQIQEFPGHALVDYI